MAREPRPTDVPVGLKSRFKRIAWFVGLWLAGVASLAVVTYLIRWAIRP